MPHLPLQLPHHRQHALVRVLTSSRGHGHGHGWLREHCAAPGLPRSRLPALLARTPPALMPPAVVAAIARLVTYPFRTVRAPALYNDVLYGAIRCMLERITIAQSRYLNPSTSARYAAHCKKQQTDPKTLQIPVSNRDSDSDSNSTIAAHWIGRPNAETVVLYLHGGGYTQPASQGLYEYLQRLVQDLDDEPQARSVAVLVLAYTLAPEASHPRQLQEAAALLSYVLAHTPRSPSDIFLAGDSAGGNLALVLLSHLLHPHADVPAVTLIQPLGGALLFSPWAGFRTDYPSFTNQSLDMLSPLALRKWSAMFLNKTDPANLEADPGPVSGDAWTEPCLNPASWWRGLHNVVAHVFVAYGSCEVLANPIQELEREMTSGWAQAGGEVQRVRFLVGPQEAHIAPIVDIMTPRKLHKSGTQVAIEEWLKARLHVQTTGK